VEEREPRALTTDLFWSTWSRLEGAEPNPHRCHLISLSLAVDRNPSSFSAACWRRALLVAASSTQSSLTHKRTLDRALQLLHDIAHLGAE
jgi:hypothetical protein